MIEFKNIKLGRDAVEGRTIAGYASTFGNIDKVLDVVEAGAFKKTLRERGKKVKVYYNHSQPIGLPIKMAEDDIGLFTESVISQTPKGDEIITLVKDGVIDEMSIAYEVVNHDPRKNGGRVLKEIKLYEYGPVDFGANEKAQIIGVKSLIATMGQNEITDESVEEIKKAIQTLEGMIQLKGVKDEPSEDTHAEPLESILVKSLITERQNFFDQLYAVLKR